MRGRGTIRQQHNDVGVTEYQTIAHHVRARFHPSHSTFLIQYIFAIDIWVVHILVLGLLALLLRVVV